MTRTVTITMHIENDDHPNAEITARVFTEGPTPGAFSWAEMIADELRARVDDCILTVAQQVGNIIVTSQAAPPAPRVEAVH
jgi:hypothetical protein